MSNRNQKHKKNIIIILSCYNNKKAIKSERKKKVPRVIGIAKKKPKIKSHKKGTIYLQITKRRKWCIIIKKIEEGT